MRLRLSSKPPLPQRKFWYSIDTNSESNGPSTIYELKERLCLNLFPDVTKAAYLLLSLDDFELLDDSKISILRDGDLIFVSHHQKNSHTSVKSTGKVETANGKPLPNKKLKRDAAPTKHPEYQRSAHFVHSSEDSSTDSSSSESSSESSTSDSETDTDTSSSTSEEGISLGLAGKLLNNIKSAPPVPPGQGKASTHSRNQRRRLKKKYDQLAASASGSVPLGGTVQDDDNGLSPSHDTIREVSATIQSTAQLPIVSSLRNKNKKKGFYNLNQRPIPPRIVFGEDGSQTTQPTPPATSEPLKQPAARSLHFIAPSEKQERRRLPPHMFVTSVDVEEGMWGKKPKTKNIKIQPNPEVEEIVLGQSEEDIGNVGGEVFDFEKAEKQWDSLPVADKTTLQVDAFLLWKELAINPQTFTPEMLLMAVRLTHVDSDTIVGRRLLRPGLEELAFGGLRLDATEGEYSGVVEGEQETLSWADIPARGCKILVSTG